MVECSPCLINCAKLRERHYDQVDASPLSEKSDQDRKEKKEKKEKKDSRKEAKEGKKDKKDKKKNAEAHLGSFTVGVSELVEDEEIATAGRNPLLSSFSYEEAKLRKGQRELKFFSTLTPEDLLLEGVLPASSSCTV